MSASGAEFGLPTVHYFWVGAIPAMLFLGVVMMPFYYGSKVRSVPEFMLRRFGPGAHLVNAISFAVAQLLIAGINLYLLGTIIHALLGWPLLGRAARGRGDRALLHHPRRAVGRDLQRGAAVLRDRRRAAAADPARPAPGRRLGRPHRQDHRGGADNGARPAAEQQLNSWPGQALSGFDSDPGRSSASSSGSASCCPSATGRPTSSRSSGRWPRTRSPSARKTPIIGVLPEDVRPVHHDPPRHDRGGPGHRDRRPQGRRGSHRGGAAGEDVTYNDALLYLMRDLLPNGLLGLAITGLLAAFMAGMAANISAFNTVFSYDLGRTTSSRTATTTTTCGRPDRHRRGDGDRDLHRDFAQRASRTSWPTCRPCSASSTRRSSRRSSSACSGSG